MVIRHLAGLVGLIVTISCSTMRFEPLKTKRQHYYGTELNINGYFFSTYGGSRDTTDIKAVFVLFEEGFFTRPFSYSDRTTKKSVEKRLISYHSNNISLEKRMGRGVYKILDKNIWIESWTYASYSPIPTYIYKGKIIDSNTIKINLFGKEETWYFQPFPYKPFDVTNHNFDDENQ